jgi:hypothetical protein
MEKVNEYHTSVCRLNGGEVELIRSWKVNFFSLLFSTLGSTMSKSRPNSQKTIDNVYLDLRDAEECSVDVRFHRHTIYI